MRQIEVTTPRVIITIILIAVVSSFVTYQLTIPDEAKKLFAEMKREKEIRIAANTKLYVMNRDFRGALRLYDKSKDYEPIKAFIRQAEPERRQELFDDFKRWRLMADIQSLTAREWWLDLAHEDPEKGAKIFLSKYVDASPAEQAGMQQVLSRLGIRTAAFARYLSKEQKEQNPARAQQPVSSDSDCWFGGILCRTAPAFSLSPPQVISPEEFTGKTPRN